MITTILRWLLLNILKVNKEHIKSANWRVARPEEPLSIILGFQPAILVTTINRFSEKLGELGLKNVVFVHMGKTRFCPLPNYELRAAQSNMTIDEYLKEISDRNPQFLVVPTSLFGYYFKEEPCVLYGRFTTMLLVKYLTLLNKVRITKLTVANDY